MLLRATFGSIIQLLNQIAQIVITYHNERVGRPLIEETCHCKGVNESNKIMVFLPGLAQIYQLCEILQRALDLGWTEMLIPLPFHGQSSREDVEAVLSASLLASTGKYPLGQNKSLFAPESFDTFSAPLKFQELWAAHREPRFARSCIVCTNVAESGITIPNCKSRRAMFGSVFFGFGEGSPRCGQNSTLSGVLAGFV